MLYAISFFLFIISVPLLMVSLLLYVGQARFLFVYKNNRRYCKKCDQQQDNYVYSWAFGSDGWWSDMCPIRDENCLCHKFSRN